jgi:tetratricopeptide (TPR) repeat protein
MARECLEQGRLEDALSGYVEGLERQPDNWALLHEVARFLTFALQRPLAGLEMARAALARNPACSAELWNMAGDSLFELGRIEEARRAYVRALGVNADDAQARYNLAFVHAQQGEHALALPRIAEALALDRAGHYREGLLHKQNEVLGRFDHQQRQRFQRMINRISAPQPVSGTAKVIAKPPANAVVTEPCGAD